MSTAAATGTDRPRPTALEATAPRVIGARADCAATTSCVVSWEIARAPVRVFAGAAPGRIDRTTPAAVARTGTEVTIPNPDPGAPRYFEVVARNARRGPNVGDRYVGLTGSPNTRDLGGYQTVDGQRTRWGRLFRSDGLTTLSDTDRARLATLGLPDTCSDGVVVEPVDDVTLRAAAAAVTSRASRARDRELLRRLARDRFPQWVQCDAFADRLGWSAALVLATLGASKETIVADHLTSARFGVPPPPDRAYVDLAFETIRRHYKTFGRYLVAGLGLDDRTYLRLRDRYVTRR